ncbi:UNVERIFIED_CONTAM: hypothetical protein K2H54_058340 [Gekko kuhli]
MGSRRVGLDCATEQQQQQGFILKCHFESSVLMLNLKIHYRFPENCPTIFFKRQNSISPPLQLLSSQSTSFRLGDKSLFPSQSWTIFSFLKLVKLRNDDERHLPSSAR